MQDKVIKFYYILLEGLRETKKNVDSTSLKSLNALYL